MFKRISQILKRSVGQGSIIQFITILLFRAIFIGILIFIVDKVVDLGTSLSLLITVSIFGIAAGAVVAPSTLKTPGVLIGFGLLFFAKFILFWLLEGIGISTYNNYFPIDLISARTNLLLICLFLSFTSTWFFFRLKHATTIEGLFVAILSVFLLSGHRNYHLDSPRILNSLAWIMGVPPQTMIIFLGGATFLLVLLYLLFGSLGGRNKSGEIRLYRTRLHNTLLSIGCILLALLVSIIGSIVYGNYNITKGLTTSGVGESKDKGDSPLGFHSALGSTNQPAALVRLEGDYSQNPFAPMLYFREGALSEFNGHEIVIAGGNYDTDVATTGPGEPFIGTQDPQLLDRISVIQSIFLLSDQKTAFAIDYPLEIRQLKNPDPAKFKSSYRSYSLAPTFKLDSLANEAVGDPRWSDEVKSHYLKQHPDGRYKNLAEQLTLDIISPVARAFAISQYLSKNAIYTLTPNHDTKPGEDPVSPFLFGDMRGYCVHFAHATVYMLRALGIPSRIGTGYLTDLRQSKDGHILLRMSDRHAWAEVYITGKGWIPFDTQPEHVESHADTQVDLKLLEELMGKLDPGEEILPKDLSKDEKSLGSAGIIRLPTPKEVELFVMVAAVFGLLLKLYIRLGWILPSSPDRRLKRVYRRIYSLLVDLGFERRGGETRMEYRARLQRIINQDPFSIGEIVNIRAYSPSGKTYLTKELIISSMNRDIASLKSIPKWKVIAAFFNPNSLLSRIR